MMPQPRLHRNHAARQAAYRSRQQQAQVQQLRARGLPSRPAISTMPGTARWTRATELAASLLSEIADEMTAYYDERSQEWQENEKGETHQQRIEAIQEVVGALESLWD